MSLTPPPFTPLSLSLSSTSTSTPTSPRTLNSTLSSICDEEPSIRSQYPKSSRLLLGTTANLQQPGFLKALQTHHPLELSLECRDLPVPRFTRRPLRPFAVLFYRSPDASSEWELIGRTETVLYDPGCRFVTKLKVICATPAQRMRELRVEIYDRRAPGETIEDQTFLGAAQCVLEDLVSEPLLKRVCNLESMRYTNPGSVIISADAIRPGDGTRLSLQMDVASITKGPARMYFILSRQLQSGDFTPVYRSEILGRDDSKFMPMDRDLAAVTGGCEDKLLRIELYQWSRGSSQKVGFVQTTVRKLCKTRRGGKLLWWPAGGKGDRVVDVGRVVLLDCQMVDEWVMFRLRVTQ